MLNLVRFWILLSSLLVSAGWILSALHQLNRLGYTAAFGFAGIGLVVWQRKTRWRAQKKTPALWHKFHRRFKRPVPFVFLLLALLAFFSGALYPALNYDANAYRLPRIFHWLAEGQWHWIHTYDTRMNVAACGFEWLAAPLMLFPHSDRLVFLVNWIPFLLLPGLIFSVFTRLQVRPLVAWWWMWPLASGWCFALQAGSVANDSFAAVYILAAVDLALRAREKKSVSDLWLSMLAAALTTGAKQSNLPLAALWLAAAWPGLWLLWRRPAGTVVATGISLLVSIFPVSFFNCLHYGTWLPLNETGIAAIGKFSLNPFWGVIGNAFCIPVQNMLPPFYNLLPPFYKYGVVLWNEMMRDFLQTPFGAHFASFEKFGFLSDYYHGISEENAGIGLGVCLLIFTSVWLTRKYRRISPPILPERFYGLLRTVPWALLLVFMAKVGTFENARQLAPYYLFLFPTLLVRPGHSNVVRQRLWQHLALLVMAVTGLMMATLSERPLFPAKTIFGRLYKQFPNSEFIADEYARYLESNYQAMTARRDYLKRTLPADDNIVGYYAGICSVDEAGIWLAGRKRQVVCILPEDSPERLRTLGVSYVVVNETLNFNCENIETWAGKYRAILIGHYQFKRETIHANLPPDLYLVRLN